MTLHRLRAFPLSLGLCVLLGSCSDSPQEVLLEKCPDSQVSVSVSPGSAPSFTWAPRCGMASLDVFPSGGGSSLWVLYSGELAAENPFRSGIVYGHAPTAALEVTGPEPLAPGTEYTVIVYRWVGDPGGPGVLVNAGTATFRP